ncbi:F0F1 ATP synthase subunit gamma [Marinobacterium rhizophilum]|uniref:F0F1 ATP synthase subunit gamma n=1 Tax=Marinobacterium rhizophilum TaxID=420402 RepID=UPI000379AEAC|nr:FoF1 ATP synthase subunit gamma [Marinobacterium rhizophilum]
MSRQQLERHLRKLREAREIMDAMKSLAFMETRRLTARLDVQQAMMHSLDTAVADFLSFYPQYRTTTVPGRQIHLLLGSERGFCGNFNERLLQALEPASTEKADLIACGHKLYSRLGDDPRLYTAIDGASVLDEVGETLNRLTETLTTLQQQGIGLNLAVLYHDADSQDVRTRQLLPPFASVPIENARYPSAPDLNLPPTPFFAELVDHYLFAALHDIAYSSLLAENRQRMQHLDGAVRYLDERLEDLARKGREIRQEEITEEIEVILLNAEAWPATPKRS